MDKKIEIRKDDKKTIDYLKRNYQSVLGDDIKLLDEENGLEKIRKKYFIG